MITGMSVAMLPRAARRIAQNLVIAVAIAASLVPPAAARVATSESRLIIIPPAKLPPLPAPDATTSDTATPAAAPQELLPTELETLHDVQGAGLAMYGTLTAKTDSASATLLAVFAHSPAFDPVPVSQLLLADEGDRRAQALFTAMAHGAPVIGVAVATLSEPGGDIAVFYDDADAFPASFPRLQQALAPSGAVEIGISDNSVYEEDAARDNNADANWDAAIAALLKGGETPIDGELARALTARLTSDTGEAWRVVSPTALR